MEVIAEVLESEIYNTTGPESETSKRGKKWISEPLE